MEEDYFFVKCMCHIIVKGFSLLVMLLNLEGCFVSWRLYCSGFCRTEKVVETEQLNDNRIYAVPLVVAFGAFLFDFLETW